MFVRFVIGVAFAVRSFPLSEEQIRAKILLIMFEYALLRWTAYREEWMGRGVWGWGGRLVFDCHSFELSLPTDVRSRGTEIFVQRIRLEVAALRRNQEINKTVKGSSKIHLTKYDVWRSLNANAYEWRSSESLKMELLLPAAPVPYWSLLFVSLGALLASVLELSSSVGWGGKAENSLKWLSSWIFYEGSEKTYANFPWISFYVLGPIGCLCLLMFPQVQALGRARTGRSDSYRLAW